MRVPLIGCPGGGCPDAPPPALRDAPIGWRPASPSRREICGARGRGASAMERLRDVRAGPGAGCPGTGGLRVRPPADALPSQEDVAAAPEDTRGEPADAGRKEGRRVGGATGGPPVTLHPIPSALPGVPRPEGGPEGGRRGRTPRPQAIAFRAGRGGTQALTPQPPGQSPAWQSPEEP